MKFRKASGCRANRRPRRTIGSSGLLTPADDEAAGIAHHREAVPRHGLALLVRCTRLHPDEGPDEVSSWLEDARNLGVERVGAGAVAHRAHQDRKSTRLNPSHRSI